MTDSPPAEQEQAEEGETVIEATPPEFAWETFAEDEDECRRAFVMSTCPAEPNAIPKIVVDGWNQMVHWLKTGELVDQTDRDPMPTRLGKPKK